MMIDSDFANKVFDLLGGQVDIPESLAPSTKANFYKIHDKSISVPSPEYLHSLHKTAEEISQNTGRDYRDTEAFEEFHSLILDISHYLIDFCQKIVEQSKGSGGLFDGLIQRDQDVGDASFYLPFTELETSEKKGLDYLSTLNEPGYPGANILVTLHLGDGVMYSADYSTKNPKFIHSEISSECKSGKKLFIEHSSHNGRLKFHKIKVLHVH